MIRWPLTLLLAGGIAVGAFAGLHWGAGTHTLQPASALAFDARPEGNPLNNAYFGDLHVHTKISVDSFLRKNMLTMEDAYRFAHGAEVQVAGGEHVKLAQPLDFVALTDHSESYHIWDLCTNGTGPESRTPNCMTLKK